MYDLSGELTLVLEHYLLVAKVKGTLVVSKRASQKFDVERYKSQAAK
jgi:hypothetical protein